MKACSTDGCGQTGATMETSHNEAARRMRERLPRQIDGKVHVNVNNGKSNGC